MFLEKSIMRYYKCLLNWTQNTQYLQLKKVPVYFIIPIIPYYTDDYIIRHLQILGIVCPNTVGASDRAGRLMLAAWRPLDVSVAVM